MSPRVIASRTAQRACKTCGKPITRFSRTGLCGPCFAPNKTAWKPQVERLYAEEAIKALYAQAQETWKPLKFPPAAAKRDTPYALELNLPDAHFGKLAWGEETGGDNYDTRIAEKVYKAAFHDLLQRATFNHRFAEIVLVFGNDMLHADTKQGTTTKGTPLDIDSRFHHNYLIAQRCAIWGIQAARQVTSNVIAIFIPGNHDTLATWTLGNAVSLYFKDDAAVEVRNTPRMMQFYEWGLNMVMFTHGNKGKLETYPGLMAQLEPEMWGRTKFREAHTGDKHHTKVHEINGTLVRIVSSLSATDAWHAEEMFLGNHRRAEAFIYHKTEGLVGTLVHTVRA